MFPVRCELNFCHYLELGILPVLFLKENTLIKIQKAKRKHGVYMCISEFRKTPKSSSYSMERVTERREGENVYK
jgi:hypothetical protein